MNRIINEEILRIQEVMGVIHKPLITESIGSFISSLGDEISEALLKKLNVLISNSGEQIRISVGGKQYLRNDVLSARDILEGSNMVTSYNNAGVNVQNVIKSIMSTDPEVSNLAYNELIKHLKDNGVVKTELEFIKLTQKFKKRNPKEDISKFLDKYFNSAEWGDLISLSENAFKKQYEIAINNTSIFKPISSQVSKSSTGNGRKLTSSEIDQAKKALRSERPKLFNRDYINALRKSANSIKADIDELSQGYYDDIAERVAKEDLSSEELEQIAKEYAVQIVRKLNILEAKGNNAAQEAMGKRNIPDNIIEVIKNDSGEFFRLYKSIWGEKQAKTLGKEIATTTSDFIRDFRKLLIKNDTTGKINFAKTFLSAFNPNTRVGQYFLTDSFAAFDRQWQQMIQQSGLQRGQRAKYIVSMAYLNSVGYIIGSTLTDIMTFINDITLEKWVNNLLPITIGDEGTEWGFTINKLDNKDSMELINSVNNKIIASVLKAITSKFSEIYDELTSGWGALADTIKTVIRRTVPFGLGNIGSSIDAKLLELITGLKIDNPKDWLSSIMSIFNSTPEAVVTPEWEDNKNSFKPWFKANYPDNFDNVTRFKRVDDDGAVYYEAQMKGTKTADMYFIYDASNKKFKKYE